MSQYVAEKYRAAQECIRRLADKSGYGHFISNEMIAEWSTDLISTLAVIDAKYNPPTGQEPSIQAVEAPVQTEQASTEQAVDTTGG